MWCFQQSKNAGDIIKVISAHLSTISTMIILFPYHWSTTKLEINLKEERSSDVYIWRHVWAKCSLRANSIFWWPWQTPDLGPGPNLVTIKKSTSHWLQWTLDSAQILSPSSRSAPKHIFLYFVLSQNLLPLFPGKIVCAAIRFVTVCFGQSNWSQEGKERIASWCRGAGKYPWAQRRYSTSGSTSVSVAVTQPFLTGTYFVSCDIKKTRYHRIDRSCSIEAGWTQAISLLCHDLQEKTKVLQNNRVL